MIIAYGVIQKVVNAAGIPFVRIFGARVDTAGKREMLYTPAYGKDDEKVPAKVEIPLVVREMHKKILTEITVIAHGERADMFAKFLNEMKEIHFFCTDTLDGYIIKDYVWGADSAKTLEKETYDWPGLISRTGISSGEGFRPKNWFVPGTDDNLIWKLMLEGRRKRQFSEDNIKSGRFGFAKVIQ